MSSFKKAQVIILPTEDKTNISLNKNNTLILRDAYIISQDDEKYQHLYIISDDEIKEGDCVLTTLHSKIEQVLNNKTSLEFYKQRAKKIIATTNTVLSRELRIQVGDDSNYIDVKYPQPSQQFIEKYIESYNKNEVITDVLVELLSEESYGCDLAYYGLSEPELKVNPKDNTIIIKEIKDTWNREEVKAKLLELLKDISDDETLLHHYAGDYREFNNWIEENL